MACGVMIFLNFNFFFSYLFQSERRHHHLKSHINYYQGRSQTDIHHSPTQPEIGAYSKPIELAEKKLNLRYKVVQRTVDKNIKNA